MRPLCIATATLTPGAVLLQRVSVWSRPAGAAVALIARAARHAKSVGEVPNRAGPYVTFCASTYPSDLAAMDAVVDRARVAGVRRANRSWLIREAVRAIDVDALIERTRSRR